MYRRFHPDGRHPGPRLKIPCARPRTCFAQSLLQEKSVSALALTRHAGNMIICLSRPQPTRLGRSVAER